MIVLANPDSTAINLGLGLEWIDQYNWNPVKSNIQFTIEGSAKVQTASISGYRPITLSGNNSRLLRTDIETLRNWSISYTNPDQFFSLAIHSDDSFSSVKFRFWEEPAIEVTPFIGENYENRNNLSFQYYNITIKLASFD